MRRNQTNNLQFLTLIKTDLKLEPVPVTGEGKTKGGRHKPLKILLVPPPSDPSGPEPPLSDPSAPEPPLSDPSGPQPPLSDPSGPESSDSAVIGPQPDGLIVELFNTEPEPSFSSEPGQNQDQVRSVGV